LTSFNFFGKMFLHITYTDTANQGLRQKAYTLPTQRQAPMAFLTDKEELKPGLVIFRRGDVQHRNWYCRVKLPKSDRYKTISLKTADVSLARDRAYDHDADLRFRIKHDVPIFNHSFSQIAKEYVELQKRRAATGQVSDARWRKCARRGGNMPRSRPSFEISRIVVDTSTPPLIV
jgi:hypothetical protein